jgi:hypothetical protein
MDRPSTNTKDRVLASEMLGFRRFLDAERGMFNE